jgi:hypothetical protein
MQKSPVERRAYILAHPVGWALQRGLYWALAMTALYVAVDVVRMSVAPLAFLVALPFGLVLGAFLGYMDWRAVTRTNVDDLRCARCGDPIGDATVQGTPAARLGLCVACADPPRRFLARSRWTRWMIGGREQ